MMRTSHSWLPRLLSWRATYGLRWRTSRQLAGVAMVSAEAAVAWVELAAAALPVLLRMLLRHAARAPAAAAVPVPHRLFRLHRLHREIRRVSLSDDVGEVAQVLGLCQPFKKDARGPYWSQKHFRQLACVLESVSAMLDRGEKCCPPCLTVVKSVLDM